MCRAATAKKHGRTREGHQRTRLSNGFSRKKGTSAPRWPCTKLVTAALGRLSYCAIVSCAMVLS